tara:strand:- start:16421 stop:17341 length:921 start_codon:yes stop_codon:yes gene_type:complete
MIKKILVTGGSGMVGSAMKTLVPDACYPTRDDQDLLWQQEFQKVDAIVHLAAKVGGVKANTDFMGDFYSENVQINQNLLLGAYKNGTKKVVSLLSTCVYPDAPYIKYPLTEDQLHLGPPHHSNFGYAYAKRMVDVMSRAYRQQYGCNFITAIPNNLYGKNDNFDLENSHVIPALIRKIWEAKLADASFVECWGDGTPVREFTYSEDIARILMFLLDNYDDPGPINIGNTEEHSIREVAELLCELLEYPGYLAWNTDMPPGQHKKPSSNARLLNLGWKKEDYTSLKDGLKKTCEWFKMNYPHVRGVA